MDGTGTDTKQLNADEIKAKTAATGKRRSHTRRFKTSSRQNWVLFSKIFALFTVSAGYFILTYFLGDTHVNQAVGRLPEQVLAFRRLNKVHLAMIFLNNAACAPSIQNGFRPTLAASHFRELDVELSELQTFQTALLYGSTEMKTQGSVKRYPARDELNFGNACRFMSFAAVNTVDESDISSQTCEDIANGVFLHGLNSAYLYFLEGCATLANQLQPLGGDDNSTRITNFLASHEVKELEYLDRSFLRYGLMVDANMYLTEQLTGNADFLKVRAGLLAGFLVLIAVAYAIVYDPMIRALDKELKRVQAMLVMVPFDVMQSTAALKKLLLL